MKIISVGQLTAYIKEKLESDLTLNNVWVKGEVSNFKHHSSGHMYFTLKDRTSALRCIMFRSRNQGLKFRPAEGMSVVARGYVTLYERDGQYQLYVEEMQPDGVGALYTAFLQLKQRLENEGLFDRQRKRPLPGFPRKVGVITSPTGAAVRDIINVLTRRSPQTHIILVPVPVQGDSAPPLIAQGIMLANSIAELDVIIVGRGGGSIEELWAFNTEIVARSIFESRIPVVSAVGHETDFTIADFVADMRAPTPSAAAELVVPDCIEVRRHIDNLKRRLVLGTRSCVSTLRERSERAAESRFLKRPKDELYSKAQDIDYLCKRLGQAALGQLSSKRNRLTLQMSRLDDMSPMATLQRGYTICRDNNTTVLTKVKQVKTGDKVQIIMSDGSLDCEVQHVKEGAYGQEKS